MSPDSQLQTLQTDFAKPRLQWRWKSGSYSHWKVRNRNDRGRVSGRFLDSCLDLSSVRWLAGEPHDPPSVSRAREGSRHRLLSSFVYDRISFALPNVRGIHCHVPHVPPCQDHQTQTKETSDDGPNDDTQIPTLLRTGGAVSSRFDQGCRRYVHLGWLRGYNCKDRRRGDLTVRESHD
jgi:hypothetical protein